MHGPSKWTHVLHLYVPFNDNITQPHLPALSMAALEQSVVARQPSAGPSTAQLGTANELSRLECGFPPTTCKATKPAALASVELPGYAVSLCKVMPSLQQLERPEQAQKAAVLLDLRIHVEERGVRGIFVLQKDVALLCL